MKKLLIAICCISVLPAIAQEHFSGISTSKRVGVINALNNPSELANQTSKLEINIFAMSINASSNKIGFDDLLNSDDFESLLFSGDKPANFKINAQFVGPSAGLRLEKWAFGITSAANIQADVVDVDPNLGLAVTTSNLFASTAISSSKNQRVNATTWGEIGFSAARTIYKTDRHQINGGLTFKLLFPGSYVNFGADSFRGTIYDTAGQLTLNNAYANLNIAYSGSLANDFSNTSDYTKSLFGNLNGVAVDFGVDYQMKNDDGSYRLKAGASVKNIGSMTFKSDDNHSTNYRLEINDPNPLTNGLNLNQFDGTESIKDIENVLISSGYLGIQRPEMKDFKVKLPTMLNLYTDVNIVPRFNASLFLQQKINEDNKNGQIASQNSFSIIPRFTMQIFEAYLPLSFNEISGTNLGLGFRLGGFFIGSNGILTALGDSNQADVYFGFRFGLQ